MKLFLLPFVVLLLTSLKVNNYKKNTTVKVSYDEGVKRYFDAYDTRIAPCLRTPAILKHLKSAHFSPKNGFFSVFCASQSHACLHKRSPHDLLTLVSSYMITRLEHADGFLWESCLNRFRKNEKENRTRKQRLIVFLETQEFSILGAVCITLFLAVMHFKGICGPRYLVEFAVSVLALLLIIFLSTDYWNINYEEVDELRLVWKEIVDEVEKDGKNGE